MKSFLALLVLALVRIPAYAQGLPHYAFVLPDGYIGWIHVVFASPNAPMPPFDHNAFFLRIDDSGEYKTQMIFAAFTGSHDEFFYRKLNSQGKETLLRVPADYACSENSGIDSCLSENDPRKDAFTVGRASVGKASDGTQGMGWFLFVGPRDIRNKVAKQKHLAPGEKYQIDVPEDDPLPGRIKE